MVEFFSELGRKLELLPRSVHWWMRWFNFLFLLAAVFAIWHEPARWVLVVRLLCFPVGFAIYHFTRDISIMGAPHIVFWAPLLIYLPTTCLQNPEFNLFSLYGIWVLLLLPTIAVSVLFEIRAAFLFFRHKSMN